MPPKKNASDSALVAILKEAGVTKLEDIIDSTLRKIYKLEDDVPARQQPEAGPSNGGLNAYLTRTPIHTFKACDNAWNTADKRREAVERSSKAAANKKLKPASNGDANGHNVLDPSCTHVHCKDNPRCLNWLGQTLWEDNKAFDRFAQQWGLSDNPEEDPRDPDIPVGLKNLGATCYVNSYLQVWFQDEPFRRGVYACAPDADKDLAKQPLYNLQVTFAALQEAPYKAFSPIDLVKSLDIDTTDQQDAQEFAKLLMTLLENQFAKQPDPQLKTLIARQFEGKMKYGTRCKACNRRSENTSSFKELEIPLKHNKTLQDQLHVALQEETLSGENQYKCEHCDKLRDAVRYTEIVQLPPVLHFSLMRFQYDFRANERKRSSSNIKFPKSINMAEFKPGAREAEWYDLRGILSHKGTSAHHGHYIAEILDARRDRWFRFDDETVTQLEIDPPVKKPAKKPRQSSPSTSTQQFYQSSSNTRKPYKKKIVEDSSSESDGPFVAYSKATSNKTNGPYASSKLDGAEAGPSSSANRCKKRAVVEDSDSEENRVATNDTVIDSKDAYMLVYVRRGGETDMQEGEPVVPSLAHERIREMDCETTSQIMKFQREEAECRKDFNELRKVKRSVYRVWHATSDDEPSLLVDKDALQSWLTAEITAEKKTTNGKTCVEADKPKEKISSDSDSDCVVVASTRTPKKTSKKPRSESNGAIDTNETRGESSVSKPVSRSPPRSKGKENMVAASMDEDQVMPTLSKPSSSPSKPRPELLAAHSRMTEEQLETARVLFATNAPENQQEETEVPKQANGHATVHIERTEGEESTAKKEEVDIHGELLSTSAPDGHRKASLRSVSTLSSDNLQCPHGCVRPSATAQMKRVSTAGIAALVACGVEITPELVIPDVLCRKCVFEPLQSRSYAQQHKIQTMQFISKKHGQANPVYISKIWLDDWQKDIPSMHVNGTEVDPPPDDPEYQRDVVCEHGGLSPDETRRFMITGRQADLLRDIFPAWVPITPELRECEICKDAHNQQLQYWNTLKKTAMAEKNTRDLSRIVKTSDFKQPELVSTRQDEEMRAVPREWMRAWRDWLKQPSIHDRPRSIDVRPFLCSHSRLTMDFNFLGDRKEFEIMFESEWIALLKHYRSKGGLQIGVRRLPGGRYETRPPVCKECRDERRKDFVEINIQLNYLVPEDIDPATKLPAEAFIIEDNDDSENTSTSATYESTVRRSTRARRPPGSSLSVKKKAVRRKPDVIFVKKDDKLKDIRIVVQELTNTPTIYQRFFFRGREIEDSAETVESIGITEGEALQVLLCDVPNEDDVDVSLLDDVVPSTRSRTTSKDKPKSNGRVEGFAGTALSGLDAPSRETSEEREAREARAAKEAMEAQAREEAEMAKAIPGTCSVCTFMNEPSMRQCEMCGADL